jgi:hypothetical protein
VLGRYLAPVAALVALLSLAAPAAATRYSPGSEGAGDPFYPLAGNGGYDVRHYSLRLSYDPAPTNSLKGLAVIRARATQNLSRFNLDLRDFMVASRVTVDGRRASFLQEKEQEVQRLRKALEEWYGRYESAPKRDPS